MAYWTFFSLFLPKPFLSHLSSNVGSWKTNNHTECGLNCVSTFTIPPPSQDILKEMCLGFSLGLFHILGKIKLRVCMLFRLCDTIPKGHFWNHGFAVTKIFHPRGPGWEGGSLAVTESARYEMVIDSPAGDVSVFWIGKRNLLGQMG